MFDSAMFGKCADWRKYTVSSTQYIYIHPPVIFGPVSVAKEFQGNEYYLVNLVIHISSDSWNLLRIDYCKYFGVNFGSVLSNMKNDRHSIYIFLCSICYFSKAATDANIQKVGHVTQRTSETSEQPWNSSCFFQLRGLGPPVWHLFQI